MGLVYETATWHWYVRRQLEIRREGKKLKDTQHEGPPAREESRKSHAREVC